MNGSLETLIRYLLLVFLCFMSFFFTKQSHEYVPFTFGAGKGFVKQTVTKTKWVPS